MRPVAAQRTTAPAWDRLRWALLVAWLLVAAGALGLGERPSSRATLEQGLSSGRVTQVHVVGGLPATATGSSLQEVHWRDGPLRRWYEVRQVSAGTTVGGDDVPTSEREVGAELALARPGLDVVRVDRLSSRATLGGWVVPAWVTVLAAVGGLLALVLVVGGPEPWRATRWAWFWLLSSPIGVVALLLLSGPVPLVPAPRDPDRRLTGGWAFLLGVLLTGWLAAAG